MKRLMTSILLAACAQLASADGLKSLENFMQTAKAGRAEFTQTVTSPAKDGQAARSKISSGEFAFQRPGRFKFDYRKPFEQLIVADGKTLWIYDAELNQVTRRPQAQVLNATPAAIVASAVNIQALRADFDLQPAPDQDGLQWVLAVPKAKDGQLQSVRVGFSGDQLVAIDMLDSFGQRSLIRFTGLQTSASLPAETFRFVLPKGADLLAH